MLNPAFSGGDAKTTPTPQDLIDGLEDLRPVKKIAILIVGQSNGVGVTHLKTAGTQRDLERYGRDIPSMGTFDTSRGSATTPFYQGPTRARQTLRDTNASDALNGGISFANSMGPELLRLLPNLEEVIFIHRSVGATPFSSGWIATSANADGTGGSAAVSTGHGATAKDAARRFIDAHPDVYWAGTLWVHGESDALEGRTTAAYIQDFRNMVEDFRDYVHQAADAPHFVTTMSKAWRNSTEGTTVAAKAAIHTAQTSLPNEMDGVVLVSLDSLPLETSDTIHYGRDNLDAGGVLIARKVAENLDHLRPFPRYRLRYSPWHREFKNLLAPCGTIWNARVANDAERGWVLTTADGGNWSGYNADMLLNTREYTKACWVKPAAGETQSGIGSFISGGTGSSTHLMLTSRSGHLDYTGSAANTMPALPADTWSHLVVTLRGTSLAVYLNGALHATYTVGTLPSDSYGSCQVGQWEGQAAFRGLMDDITVLPWAVDGNGAAALYAL